MINVLNMFQVSSFKFYLSFFHNTLYKYDMNITSLQNMALQKKDEVTLVESKACGFKVPHEWLMNTS